MEQELNYLMELVMLDEGDNDNLIKNIINELKRKLIITTEQQVINQYVEKINDEIIKELETTDINSNFNLIKGKIKFCKIIKV